MRKMHFHFSAKNIEQKYMYSCLIYRVEVDEYYNFHFQMFSHTKEQQMKQNE